MNILVVAAFVISPALALANPFDHFVGRYSVEGAPTIRIENAKTCNRFDFSHLTGLRIEKVNNGYLQTHLVYFDNLRGAFGEPIMEFENMSHRGSGQSYARTTGTEGVSASNEHAYWDQKTKDSATISIEKTASDFVIRVLETRVRSLSASVGATSACQYEAHLQRVP